MKIKRNRIIIATIPEDSKASAFIHTPCCDGYFPFVGKMMLWLFLFLIILIKGEFHVQNL
jgi:hypothetical protein